MTQKQRNDAIIRKIEAYTAKFAATKTTASDALRREGFNIDCSKDCQSISDIDGWGGLT